VNCAATALRRLEGRDDPGAVIVVTVGAATVLMLLPGHGLTRHDAAGRGNRGRDGDPDLEVEHAPSMLR
jgi:hypothetical protein